jgi:F-type H+-transporting ATPase subunit b
MIDFSLRLIFDWGIQVVSILVIVWILKKLLFKPVTEFIENRKAAIAKEVEDADMAKNNAMKLKIEYENKLSEVDQEVDAILKQAREKALRQEAQMIEAAKKEAEAIKNKAFHEIKLEQNRVQAQMKEEMIEVAALMASKFVQERLDESQQAKYIDEIITEMGDVQWLN